MHPIIEVKGIGKKYKINHQKGGYVTLRDIIGGIIQNPFSYFGRKAKEIVGINTTEAFWALKEVNFNIMKGEVVGIIGHNGAGKSTLLKILSQITPPTTGEIKIHGVVGSLLEVGTGFHPELTGRENIFLNGVILGMKKKEIIKKFDQIVSFAGIDKFLDTPVKYYSSGMYVRLAFSVAAHMDTDILIIDEVLAVGDAEFQEKCMSKMEEITKKQGRTILFVSHTMSAIKRLCDRSMLIENGTVKMIGQSDTVVDYYLSHASNPTATSIKERRNRTGNQDLKITDCYLVDGSNKRVHQVISGEPMTFIVEYECKKNINLSDVMVEVSIVNANRIDLFNCYSGMTKTDFGTISGTGSFKCTVKKNPLTTETYYVNARITSNEIELDYMLNIFSFDVTTGDFFKTGSNIRLGQFYVEQEWKKDTI